MISYVELKTKQNKTELMEMKQTGGCQRWVGKMDEGVQIVHTSNYEINKSWELMYSMVTVVNTTVLHI